MRYVFVDEAGTSVRERVTVVVGLIVDADRQLLRAEAAVREVLGGVPATFRKGFIFHASEIWGHSRYRELWGLPDRLALLRGMMRLPIKLDIPIAVAIVRRTHGQPLRVSASKSLSAAQQDHLIAFHACVARADKLHPGSCPV